MCKLFKRNLLNLPKCSFLSVQKNYQNSWGIDSTEAGLWKLPKIIRSQGLILLARVSFRNISNRGAELLVILTPEGDSFQNEVLVLPVWVPKSCRFCSLKKQKHINGRLLSHTVWMEIQKKFTNFSWNHLDLILHASCKSDLISRKIQASDDFVYFHTVQLMLLLLLPGRKNWVPVHDVPTNSKKGSFSFILKCNTIAGQLKNARLFWKLLPLCDSTNDSVRIAI